MTLSNKNMSPSSDWVVSPWPAVSLVTSDELPAARMSPTRLRMKAGKRSDSRAAKTSSARLSRTTRLTE